MSCLPENTTEEKWLFSACKDGLLERVKQLSQVVDVQHVQDLSHFSCSLNSLHHAARGGHVDVVRYLVTEAHCDPNVKNIDGWTPLHYACSNRHINVVRYLVTEAHCCPNAKDRNGWTPLHYACQSSHFGVIRCLVTEAHCDPNVKTNDGWTPLHYACKNKYNIVVVRYLVTEAHCDPNVKDNNGLFSLHYACKNNYINIVGYLVTEAHCDPNVRDNNGLSPLHYACKNKYIDVVRYLVTEAHCDPNVKDDNGLSPLHYACNNGHLYIVRCLVTEAHCDLNVKDNEGQTPLLYACKNDFIEVVRCLVTAHCNTNIMDNGGQTPLHYACINGHFNIVRYLVTQSHCNPNIKNNVGQTPLHYACWKTEISVIKCMITEAHCDPNGKDNGGDTYLHYACKHGHLSVVRYLVTEAHCDPNIRNNAGMTPLHCACSNRHIDIVRYLGTHHDPNTKDNDGQTPLHYACWSNHFEFMKCLVTEAHCDPNVKDNDGQTPLHCACQHGHLAVVKYLVNKTYCDSNAGDNGRETALHYACKYGHLDVVRYLVTETDCDSDAKDSCRQTPLHYACKHTHINVVKYLVTEAHCDPNVKNSDGQTPLHCACSNGHLNVVNCLAIDAHCDPNETDNYGQTPLHYACREGAVDIVDYLLTKFRSDPNYAAEDGTTPLVVAKDTNIIRLLLQHGAVATDLYKCREVLPMGTPMLPAQSTVAVFMVGDKGAGKSTLTKALITEKEGVSSWAAKRFKVGGVKEKTAGIECHTIHSSRIGRVTIYDLAGHREFHNSHDTVIRNRISGPSSGMFLFVVNLTTPLDDLKRSVCYWLSFIKSQMYIGESVQVLKPHVLAVGSHADSVENFKEKSIFVQQFCETAENIHFVGYIAVDCRYSESRALTQLRLYMRDTIKTLQCAAPRMTFHVHCFHVYLVSKCGRKPGMQLNDLMKIIESDPLAKKWFLPISIDGLHKACSHLNKMGIVLFIKTKSTETSWIVIDKDMLLHKVNGSVFAPEDFYEYKELTRTGVVPFSKICNVFNEFIITKEIDPQLIVDFLIHMEFCREMAEDDVLKLVAETHPEYKEERHFLFPALTPPNTPPDIWQPNPPISYSEYNTCWLLQCCDHNHYLTSRFREVLLLRLAFTHAFAVKPEEVDRASPALHQNCTIWKYGIKWTTRSFIDVLVEVTDDRVVLLLCCKEGKELSLVKIRSQVIVEILTVKTEFCRNAETVEKFVSNPVHPVDTTSSVFLTNIADAISSHEDGVHLSSHTLLDIAQLLYFEPYRFCNPQCLVDIYSKQLESLKVTSHFIEIMSTNISCVDDFCTILNVPLHKVAVDSCNSDYLKSMRMFQVWQSQSEGTYQCLRQHMDQYSVFSGRSILDVAKVPMDSLPPPSPLTSKHNIPCLLDKLDGHMTALTSTISLDLIYFSNKFIESGFVTETAARATLTKLGISDEDKASQLLHLLRQNYTTALEKQVWAEKFIAIFASQAAYSDLATQLRREILPESISTV